MSEQILKGLKQIASYLEITRDQAGYLARDKKIPAYRLGKFWRAQKTTLDQWIEQQEIGGG